MDEPSESAGTAATKICPMCAEEIKEQARVCRYCGARFEVGRKGYCSACHAIVQVDDQDRCTTCGAPVVDPHLESAFVEEGRPPIAGGQAAATENALSPAQPQAAVPAAAPSSPSTAAFQPAATAATGARVVTVPVADASARADEIVSWAAIASRTSWAYGVASVCALGVIVGCWFLEWGRTSGGVLITIYRGPLLLPFVGIVAAVLGSLVIRNRRPRGARVLSSREWARQWARNRRSKGFGGAYPGRYSRLVLAAGVCLLWAVEVVYAVWGYRHIAALVGAGERYGGIITVGFAAVGLLCALVGFPLPRRQVRIDSDGTIYD